MKAFRDTRPAKIKGRARSQVRAAIVFTKENDLKIWPDPDLTVEPECDSHDSFESDSWCFSLMQAGALERPRGIAPVGEYRDMPFARRYSRTDMCLDPNRLELS